ncbi:MAG: LUD domain-containing protein, partial [Lachnospiraceae bacterium]
MATPKQQTYENLADSLIDAFNRRGIEGYYCPSREEALTTALRFLTPGCSVSWGGSASCTEIGLFDALKKSDCILYDRSTAKTPEEQRELYTKAVTSDYYFMSSN